MSALLTEDESLDQVRVALTEAKATLQRPTNSKAGRPSPGSRAGRTPEPDGDLRDQLVLVAAEIAYELSRRGFVGAGSEGSVLPAFAAKHQERLTAAHQAARLAAYEQRRAAQEAAR